MTTAVPQITLPEAQRILGVSKNTIRRWAKNGTLRTVLVGTRYRTTSEWIEQVVKTPPSTLQSAESRPTKLKGISNDINEDCEEALRFLKAEFGL